MKQPLCALCESGAQNRQACGPDAMRGADDWIPIVQRRQSICATLRRFNLRKRRQRVFRTQRHTQTVQSQIVKFNGIWMATGWMPTKKAAADLIRAVVPHSQTHSRWRKEWTIVRAARKKREEKKENTSCSTCDPHWNCLKSSKKACGRELNITLHSRFTDFFRPLDTKRRFHYALGLFGHNLNV
jgi:hypothetical protein